MSQVKVKNDSTVFYPSRTNMIIIALVIVIFSVAAGFMIRNLRVVGEMSFFIYAYVAFLAVAIWMMIMVYFQSRVEFKDAGMLFVRGGSQLFIPYEDMSHFYVRSSGKNKSIGVKLTHKIKPQTRGIADRIFYGWATDYIDLLPYTKLPTQGLFRPKVDPDKVKRTEFGKVLYEYAPHLFVEDEKRK